MTASYIGSDLSVAIAWLAWTLIILYLAWPAIHRALQPRHRTPAPARRHRTHPRTRTTNPRPYDWTTDD